MDGTSAFFESYLRSLGTGLDLSSLVWPEELRPAAAETHPTDIPLFDLAPILEGKACQKTRAEIIAKMSRAASETGFFRIKATSKEEEAMLPLQQKALAFFQQPLSYKQTQGGKFGYSAAGPSRDTMRSWHETLYLLLGSRNARADGQSKDVNSLSFVVYNYANAMKQLGQLVLKLLLEGLRVEHEVVTQHYHNGLSTARINFYPPCPDPASTFGLPAHTDSGTLTILREDPLVGGLQVLKDGMWFAVVPQPGCFIVNIGDCLQVWTNGAYRSVQHRVVVNSKSPRLSFAFFYNPRDDTSVYPLKELTTTRKQLAIYKPFTWGEYLRFVGGNKAVNALDNFKTL